MGSFRYTGAARRPAKGRSAAQNATLGHGDNIRRYFFDVLTPVQAAAIRD